MGDRWTLEGRTALVTGGTKGIGRGIVKELLEKGARVLFTARSEEDIRRTEKELSEGKTLGIQADVSTRDGRLQLFNECLRSLNLKFGFLFFSL